MRWVPVVDNVKIERNRPIASLGARSREMVLQSSKIESVIERWVEPVHETLETGKAIRRGLLLKRIVRGLRCEEHTVVVAPDWKAWSRAGSERAIPLIECAAALVQAFHKGRLIESDEQLDLPVMSELKPRHCGQHGEQQHRRRSAPGIPSLRVECRFNLFKHRSQPEPSNYSAERGDEGLDHSCKLPESPPHSDNS